MAFEEERIGALLSGELPAALEERLRNLDRLSAEAARGMEELGRRADAAMETLLRRGGDVESLLQRLAASLRDQVLERSLLAPVERITAGGLGSLMPGAGVMGAAAAAFGASTGWQGSHPGGNGPITINVSAPGGDPAQVRRSIGRAASELARVVDRGRRHL